MKAAARYTSVRHALAVVGLVLPVIVGCRTNPAIPLLERQLRLQEDEIYRLRATMEDLQDAADACQDRAGDAPRPAFESEIAPRRRSGAAVPNGVRPPVIELPSRPTDKTPESLRTPAESLPSEVPNTSGAGEPVSFIPLGDSRQAASIVLDRALTGGIGSGDRSGDQGLLVVVEPRDAAGRTVDAPADISVVVLDPALEGDAAQVARWEFTAAETAALFRRVGSSRAVHLAMAWPDDPPKHNRLRLFVRYVTADGRKLQADGPIEVAMVGQQATRWTPATRIISDPQPQVARRPDESKPRRPVWSPQRR